MTPGMSCPCAMRPQPIWPTRMRLLAPQAREGMISGATAAPRAADRTRSRRVIFIAVNPFRMEGEPSICATKSKPYWTKSLVTKRLDRIQARSLACGIQPEHNAYAGADCQRRDHDLGARDHSPAEFLRQQVPTANTKNDTQGSTNGGEHQCLDQELRHDVRGLRAYGHADADLSRTFCHRHQHDVHDADAANHQRHQRNREQ